jgi:hypothetical protein
MKSTIISMIIVLMVMVALPIIFLGDGNYAQKLGFGGSGGGGKPARLPSNVQTVVTDKKVEVYSWTDANGIKQFSNTPPPEGGASEKIVLSPMNSKEIQETMGQQQVERDKMMEQLFPQMNTDKK